MELLGHIFLFFKTECKRPEPFGVFHIVMMAVVFITAIIIIKKFRLGEEKMVRKLLFVLSAVTILLEIYKQILYSFNYGENGFVFSYAWRVFPWQFCSTPMIAGLLAAVIKKGRIHKALCCYLATYGLFAGLLTVITGGNIFSGYVGINFQTAVCHGAMTVIGLYLLATGYVKADFKTIGYALPVFLAGLILAVALNYLIYNTVLPAGQVFDMYYISPYFIDNVAVMKPFKELFGHFLPIVYALVYTGFSAIIIIIAKLFSKRIP